MAQAAPHALPFASISMQGGGNKQGHVLLALPFPRLVGTSTTTIPGRASPLLDAPPAPPSPEAAASQCQQQQQQQQQQVARPLASTTVSGMQGHTVSTAKRHQALQAPLHSLLDAFMPFLHQLADAQQQLQRAMRRFGGAGDWQEASTWGQEQRAPEPAYSAAQRLFDQALALEKALDPLGAAKVFSVACQAEPHRAEWVTRLAKAYSDSMYAPGATLADKQR